jgi:hypothetical protein
MLGYVKDLAPMAFVNPASRNRLPTLDEVANALLLARDSAERLRIAADWYTRARRQELSVVRNSIDERPSSSGDPRWDAMLAGFAEQLCLQHGLQHGLAHTEPPPWAMRPEYFLRTWWFLSPYASLHPSAYLETPAALANRGVFVHAADLASI